MPKQRDKENTRRKPVNRNAGTPQPGGFTPCSPDMTLCGDCDDNRSKRKCPRLREWLDKKPS